MHRERQGNGMMDSPIPALLLEARQEADKLSQRVERLVALVEEALVETGSEQALTNGGHANGGDVTDGARLIALQMALAGHSHEAVAERLRGAVDEDDLERLLRDVFAG
jgi:hypothetical protein